MAKKRKIYQISDMQIQPEKGGVVSPVPVHKRGVPFFHILLSFCVGLFLGLILLVSSYYLRFEKTYQNRLYPGIKINNVDFSGKTKEEVKNYFKNINRSFDHTQIYLSFEQKNIATMSAKSINTGLDENLISEQAYLLGRGPFFLSNIILKTQAYLSGITLSLAIDFDKGKAGKILEDVSRQTDIKPKNALFSFSAGRVVAFNISSDGRKLNREKTLDKLSQLITSGEINKTIVILPLVVEAVLPQVATDQANSLGIRELIGSGTSTFFHSIPNRVHNVGLAASRLNGILIAPGETFSFDKALGDISAFTGYKTAYVIQNGKTVLGDGGGVCQVSTTFFRASLNSGLPILERWAHAYRVGYYEQDQPPGLDATIFIPTNDLKIKNDTPAHILIQTSFDPQNYRLTISFYGQKDGRISTISQPIISHQSPAPEAIYQDDPTLPKGEVKQVDFAAPGATSTFYYEVKKNNELIFGKKFVSVYRPWQAIYLRGTKE